MRSAPLVLLAVVSLACSGGGGGGTAGGTGTAGSGSRAGGSTAGSGGTAGGSDAGGSGATAGGSGATAGGTSTAGGSGTAGGVGTAGGSGMGTINVTGKVINTAGQPVASATVVIIGKGTITSDAMGNFSFTQVTTPYDLCTTAQSGSLITVMKGVTRADPTITAFVAPTMGNSGTITGSMTAPGNTLPIALLNRSNMFMFESPETTGNSTVTGADAGYSVGVGWVGPATTTGNMHGLQLTRSGATQLPSSYQAYGTTTNIILANGNTAGMRNIAGNAVTSQTMSGMVTVPAVSNLMLSQKSFGLRIGNGGFSLGSETNMNTAFSYTAPSIPNSTLAFTAVASGMGRTTTFTRWGLAANATGVNVTLASPPQLSIPAASATGIALASQSFSWAAMDPPGLYEVRIIGGGRAFQIFTTATSLVVPSTVELGLGMFPMNTGFTWYVIGNGNSAGAPTIDQLLGPTGTKLAPPATGDTWTGQSEMRSFTGQ